MVILGQVTEHLYQKALEGHGKTCCLWYSAEQGRSFF
ncbi:hypothetical protein J0S82_001711, partial [Galemys pyrenaicus]